MAWLCRPIILGLAAWLMVPWPATAVADPVTLNGITFSDEIGGFVIVERVTDDAPAILVVRNFSAAFGNPTRTQHLAGFAITKVVINDTAKAWQSYELELQERLGEGSTYGDGLSFGQHPGSQRSFSSDRYGDLIATDEPMDGVVFRDGVVRPGQRVAFSFFITDNTPNAVFYLVQSRDQPLATAPIRPIPPSKG